MADVDSGLVVFILVVIGLAVVFVVIMVGLKAVGLSQNVSSLISACLVMVGVAGLLRYSGGNKKPSTNAFTWPGYKDFADNYTMGVKGDSKLAKALAFCFTNNGDREDFDNIVREVTPQEFVDAMHTPVDYQRDNKRFEHYWIAEGAELPTYPYNVLFLQLFDNFDSSIYNLLWREEDLEDYLEHQDRARHFLRTYFQMLKTTRRQPPPDNIYNTENHFYYSLQDLKTAVVQQGYLNWPQWSDRPSNVIDDIFKIYNFFKKTSVLGGRTLRNITAQQHQRRVRI